MCMSRFPYLFNGETKYAIMLSAFEKYGEQSINHENEEYGALMKIECIIGKEGAIYFIPVSHVAPWMDSSQETA